MNATHIVTTQLTTAANTAANANSANAADAPVDADAALAFGLMLGEEIDAAALLGAKDEKIAVETLPVEETPATDIAVDPSALGLQLAMPAQAVPVAQGTASGKADAKGKDMLIDAAGASRPKVDMEAAPLPREPADTSAGVAKIESKDVIPVIAAAVDVAAAKAEVKAVAPGNESTQALAAIQSTHAAAARPMDQAPAVTLTQPVGSDRWNNELGQTVNLLIRGDQTHASLHVTPPDMGPIEIKINLSGDQASINFTVQHADTRQALENALPRLREMLADSGINLGQSQVSHQSAEQRQAQGDTPRGQFGAVSDVGHETVVQTTTRIGLVDTFA